MPKMKTNSGAAKRFKQTGSGHFKHKQSHLSHILTKKPSKRKRQLGAHLLINYSDEAAIRQMMPYC